MDFDQMVADPNFGATQRQPPAEPPPQQQPLPIMSHTWMPGWVPAFLRDPTPATEGNVPGQTETGRGLAYGFTQGVQDIWSDPSVWLLQKGADAGLVDQATVDKARDAAKKREADFQQNYGDSSAASVGRIAGQVAATAPAMTAAGGMLSAAGRAAPAIAPVTDFVAGAAGGDTAGWGGTALRGASRATQGAWTGGAQSALSGQDVGAGALTGAVAGPLAGAVLGPLSSALGRLTGQRIGAVGAEIPDEVAANARQAQTLTDAGVPLKTSQVSPDPIRQEASKVLGGGPDVFEDQLPAFRRAAMTRAGMAGSIADDATIAANDTRIGQGIDTIVDRNPFHYSAIEPDLSRIESGLDTSNLDADGKNIIRARLNDIVSRASDNNGVISGQTYRALTDSNSDLDKLIGDERNAQVGDVARQIKGVIQNGFTSVASPEDQAALQALQQQYRATRAIEGARQSNDTFLPAGLVSQTDRQARIYGGTGTLDDLANAGNTILTPAMSEKTPYSKWVGGGIGLLGSVAGGQAIAEHLSDLPGLLSHPITTALMAGAAAGARGLSRWSNASPTSVQQAINAATRGNPPMDLRTAVQMLTQAGGAQPPF